MKKVFDRGFATLLIGGLALLSACTGGMGQTHTLSNTVPGKRLPDLHAIVHREGVAPDVKFVLPDTADIMDRRVWLEDKYPWLKNPQQSYTLSGTTLQSAVEGIVPQGVHIYWGDVDREKVISFDFSSGDLYTTLRSLTRVAHTNFDVIAHHGEVGILVTTHETFQTTIPAPDVQNQYVGMNGNMLSAIGGGMGGSMGGLGSMGGGLGGYGGSVGAGGFGGMGGLGSMGGSMGGSTGGSSSAGLLMVTSMSGMQTFWQDLTNVLNGLASGFCTSPLATVASQMSMGGGGLGMAGGNMGLAGGPAGFVSPQGYSFQNGAQGGFPGGIPGGMHPPGGPGMTMGPRPGYSKNMPCGRVRVSPDSGLGYIYAYDKVDNIFRIRQYMDKIKGMLHRQVFLKVDIAEIDLTKTDQYGINWSNVLGKVGSTLSFASPSASLANLGVGATTTTASGIGAVSNNYALGVVSGASNSDVLQALSEVTHVHLVNQPRIMTVSGPAVTINTTKSEPYLQSEMPFIAGGLSSASEIIPQIGFVPVGVSLVLTPTIRESGKALSLYVAPTLNVLEGFDTINAQGVGSFQEPIVDSRSLSSIINVKSGDTVIFGGLISSNVKKQRWSIPGLGNWFPALFSGYDNVKSTTELVFLITPVIVSDKDMLAIERNPPSTQALVHAKTDSLFMRQTPQPGMRAPFLKKEDQ